MVSPQVAAVDRAASEIASRRFECVSCKRVFKNEAGLKSHLKLVRHGQETDPPAQSEPPPRSPEGGAAISSVSPVPDRPTPRREISERMLGHLFGLIFICIAVLLASKAVVLTDEEEELAGEIWHPVYLEYKDDPSVAWLFKYLPVLTAVAATCAIGRKKYDAYQDEKKKTPAKILPSAAPADVAEAAS